MKTEQTNRLFPLFRIFFSISAVTLGGGLAMLPMMQREFVEKRNWMTEDDMVDTVAVMQSSPGVIAVNMAILIGYRAAGIAGALAASAGAVLPPFLSIIVIAALMHQLKVSPALESIFTGVRAAVCALILVSVIKLSRKVLTGRFAWAMTLVVFMALTFFDLNAIFLIIAAALTGFIMNFRRLIKR